MESGHCRPPDTAVVLAAGFGTRLGALTRFIPKPLVKVSGKRLIHYVFDWLIEGGISYFHVNLHYRAQLIKSYLQNFFPKANITYYDESDRLLGTGGAIQAMLSNLGQKPFIVINSDVIMIEPLSGILTNYLRICQTPYLILDENQNSDGYGKIEVCEDIVCKILNTHSNKFSNSRLAAFCGVSILDAELWLDAPYLAREKCLVRDVLIPWLSSGRNIYSYTTRLPMFNIGTLQNLHGAENFFKFQSLIIISNHSKDIPMPGNGAFDSQQITILAT